MATNNERLDALEASVAAINRILAVQSDDGRQVEFDKLRAEIQELRAALDFRITSIDLQVNPPGRTPEPDPVPVESDVVTEDTTDEQAVEEDDRG